MKLILQYHVAAQLSHILHLFHIFKLRYADESLMKMKPECLQSVLRHRLIHVTRTHTLEILSTDDQVTYIYIRICTIYFKQISEDFGSDHD